VRALVRQPTAARALAAAGVELVAGDLHDAGALGRLSAGCAAIVHAAGAVRGNCAADFDQVNARGTGELLAALHATDPPPRLLLLSSLAAREPHLSWYAASKRAGEELLRSAGTGDWVILRPPAVYGPGDREMLGVFRAMSHGLAVVPGDPGARLSLVHIADLMAGIDACLHSAACAGHTLTLCDGKDGGYDWRELATIAQAVWGHRVRLWPVPRRLLDGIAAGNLRLARLAGRPAMLTPAKLRELRHPDWVTDNDAITAATGWTPGVDLHTGLTSLDL